MAERRVHSAQVQKIPLHPRDPPRGQPPRRRVRIRRLDLGAGRRDPHHDGCSHHDQHPDDTGTDYNLHKKLNQAAASQWSFGFVFGILRFEHWTPKGDCMLTGNKERN